MRKVFIPLLVLFVLVSAAPVAAQAEAPWVVDTTVPVSDEVKVDVEAWLGLNAPAPVTYWAITHVENQGAGYLVSLVGLNIEDPQAVWHITDSNDVAWIGTVEIDQVGQVEPYSQEPEETSAVGKLAAPNFNGGGSYLRFPWAQGGMMMYGSRGVHAAGGGGAYAQGFQAVDFLGGDDMGSGVASNSVYAVDAGAVDYVCSDSNTTLVRTHNGSTDDYFIYAHLIDNANLEIDHEFSTGSKIGTLKYGSFDDNCGWADQQDDHYHLHFGFQPDNGAFRMEDCILIISSGKWTCGTDEISTGEFLVSNGASGGSGGDGDGDAVEQASFWDYVTIGVVEFWTRAVIANLPEHENLEYTQAIYDTVKLTLRLAWVLLYSNINLGPMVTLIIAGFAIKAIMAVAEFVAFLFKAWKSLVPIIGA